MQSYAETQRSSLKTMFTELFGALADLLATIMENFPTQKHSRFGVFPLDPAVALAKSLHGRKLNNKVDFTGSSRSDAPRLAVLQPALQQHSDCSDPDGRSNVT